MGVHLGVMAKSIFASPILNNNQLDGKTWIGMSEYFDHITVIGLSKQLRFESAINGNVRIILLPNWRGLLGGILYLMLGIPLALWLTFSNHVHVWSLSEPVSGIAVFPIRLFTRTKVVFQIQGEIFALPRESYSVWKARAVSLVSRLICGACSRVRAVSRKVADQAVAAGVPREKISVIYSRTDSRTFDPNTYRKHRISLRRELGIPDGIGVIVFVGRLVPTKGVSYLLKALDQLRHETDKFRMLIVGGGPLEPTLRAECRMLGLDALVHFYGRVPYAQVPALLSAGDIFVAPSLDEGMPRAVLEALSMELPVVVTDVGGNAEILEGTKCGYLLKPRDVEGIKTALYELLSRPDLTRQMGQLGRTLIMNRFDFVPLIKQLAAVHRNLVTPEYERLVP